MRGGGVDGEPRPPPMDAENLKFRKSRASFPNGGGGRLERRNTRARCSFQGRTTTGIVRALGSHAPTLRSSLNTRSLPSVPQRPRIVRGNPPPSRFLGPSCVASFPCPNCTVVRTRRDWCSSPGSTRRTPPSPASRVERVGQSRVERKTNRDETRKNRFKITLALGRRLEDLSRPTARSVGKR